MLKQYFITFFLIILFSINSLAAGTDDGSSKVKSEYDKAVSLIKQAKNKPKDYLICLNLCGTGEKDLNTIQEHIGKDFE